jgi:hypothetical protein
MGEWKLGERSGYGVQRYKNRDRYDGKWMFDKRNGEGWFRDAAIGGTVTKGVWF